MKKLKLTITAIALCFASMTSFASEIEPTPSNQAFRSQIVSLLGSEFPDYLTENGEITADISLMLNNNNELIVVSTTSENQSLDNYVKGKLNYQKIDVKGLKKGEIYKVPLTIKQS
jgi:hypothetical protein